MSAQVAPTPASSSKDTGSAPPNAQAVARELLALEFAPIPLDYGAKSPPPKGWQQLRVAEATLAQSFPTGVPKNVGVIIGEASADQIAVDIDCPEALRIAPYVLPKTERISGRASWPASKYWYRGTAATIELNDPIRRKLKKGKTMVVELMGAGRYAVMPGSWHPDGEPYQWLRQGEPTAVDDQELTRRVRLLFAATLLARYWPVEGGRNAAAKALAGGLLRLKWSPDQAAEFIRWVAVGAEDEEAKNRVDTVKYTQEKLQRGEKTTGWPDLEKALQRSGVAAVVRNVLNSSDHQFAEVPAVVSVPDFPLEVLPPLARQFVVAGAASLGVGTPPDPIAVPLLVFAGAAIGNNVTLQVKPGFEQRAVLYAAVVAPPGTAKSPAIEIARLPLNRLQDEAHQQYQVAHDTYVAEKDLWHSLKPQDRASPTPPKEPEMAHYYTTDATMEAAAVLLAKNPAVALYQDELVSWVKSCDAYRGGRGGDRQRWLSMWALAPLKVDRKGSPTLYVSQPCMPVIGGVQPDLLPELADEAGRRDGFVERVLWTMPAMQPVPWSEEVVPPDLIKDLTDVFRRLRQATPGQVVVLSAAARATWIEWYNENTRETEVGGLAGGIYAKMPVQVARLALILHCLHQPDRPGQYPLSGPTMAAATELAEYFCGHAQRVLPYFQAKAGGRSMNLAARVRRILEKAAGAWVRRTDLHTGLGRHHSSEELSEALGALLKQGVAERREVGEGVKRTEEWRLLDGEDPVRTDELMNQGSPNGTSAEETTPPIDSSIHQFAGAANGQQPDFATMHPCPGCGKLISPTWTACSACEEPLSTTFDGASAGDVAQTYADAAKLGTTPEAAALAQKKRNTMKPKA